MNEEDPENILYRGKHISLIQREGWEVATRNTNRPAVAVVAVTHDRRVVLVEQHRPPVGHPVIEIPAGLAGDVPGQESEELLSAAQRELLEETGYAARRWTELTSGYCSPGLTDERIYLFLAEDLDRQGPGGGDESAAITLHEVALDKVVQWLHERHAVADLKTLAGLYAAEMHLAKRQPDAQEPVT